MAEAQEMLGRILRHQAEIACEVGVIERPMAPKISRRRPLSG